MGYSKEFSEASKKMSSSPASTFAFVPTNVGGASFFDRAELLMIMTEIDELQFVDNKNIFLDNLLKLASFQCMQPSLNAALEVAFKYSCSVTV